MATNLNGDELTRLNQELQSLYTQRNETLEQMNNASNRMQDTASKYTESRWDDVLGGFKSWDMANMEGYVNEGQRRLGIINKQIEDVKNRKNKLMNQNNETPDIKQQGPSTTGGGTMGGGSTTGGGTRSGGNNKVWNANAVKQPEPTYVDPSGVTHTGMTQDEFDASMKMYEADNQGWYENRRNQVVGANGATRGQIFDQALDKFLSNPDAFSEDQKQLLIKAGKELGYFNGTSETPTTSGTPTVTPTVQPTITTPTQRKINNANDAYYAGQNAGRGVVL